MSRRGQQKSNDNQEKPAHRRLHLMMAVASPSRHHPFVALASVYCSHALSPSVAENHQGGSNFRFSTNDFDCAGRGALTSEGPHRIDHAHGYGSNFYRSAHRHFNCPRSRCLSVALATSTSCAKPIQTRTAAAAAMTGEKSSISIRTQEKWQVAGFSLGCNVDIGLRNFV
jgi:hypothetical protein